MRLEIEREDGANQADVKATLARLHIDATSWRVSDDAVSFQVSSRQARWAEYVLCRSGYRVTSRAIDARNAGWASRARGEIRAWDERTPRRKRQPWGLAPSGPGLGRRLLRWLMYGE